MTSFATTFIHSRPTNRTDVSTAVDASTELISWTTRGVTLSLLSISNGTATYQATYPSASASTRFFRPRIT